MKRSLAVGVAAVVCSFGLGACAKQVAKQQIAYVSVDSQKYGSVDALNADLDDARTKCSTPKNVSNNRQGSNAVGSNAVGSERASTEELSEASFDACMAERGFLRQD